MNANEAVCHLLESCDYEPIAAYGLIGDCRSAGLVSSSGSLDWLCLPDFSSPSLFAALLDRRRGGRFLLRPRSVVRRERRYLADSAVLQTVFHCSNGVVALTEFMTSRSSPSDCFKSSDPGDREDSSRVVRILECRSGRADVDLLFQPCPDYGRQTAFMELVGREGQGHWECRWKNGSALLLTDADLIPDEHGTNLVGDVQLSAGERCRFVLLWDPSPSILALPRDQALAATDADLSDTLRGWRQWSERCSYQGRYRDAVLRSCITLKLLSHRLTGAVVAAPTTSLPESFAAPRNWDYRFCWLRDTSLLLQSFIDLGFSEESDAFLNWLLQVDCDPQLRPCYGVFGRPVTDEIRLNHLEGYRGCGPVRIGNLAHSQLQLDIYGEVIQTAHRYSLRGGRLNMRERRLLIHLGHQVCRLWREPDQSIWEPRAAPRHYTYSKLMCWVALDRLRHLHQRIGLEVDVARLQTECENVRQWIDENGFDPKRGAYVRSAGEPEADASLLLLARYRYLDARDPRMAATYRFIHDELSHNGLLYRYRPEPGVDGVSGRENLFAVCSFWAVDCLARAGKVKAAIALYERLLALGNDLGLYAEQFDATSRAAMGNFPQAFSHSGLITAALAIEQAEAGKKGHEISS